MKKELSSDQSNELLKTVKTRFEKNMSRHKGLEWSKIQAKLEAHPDKLWSLDEMEISGGEPDVVARTRKRESTFFMIVHRKVRRVAEVYVMTIKRWRPGKKISQQTVQWKWRQIWELSF